MNNFVVFLGFVLSRKGIEMDPCKGQSILDWPIPTTSTEIRSFHRLDKFYKRFSIMAPIIECMKKAEFKWTSAATQTFERIKRKIMEAPIF